MATPLWSPVKEQPLLLEVLAGNIVDFESAGEEINVLRLP
jgi:hypothetical protein